ncbi:MAG TPA: 2-amino-4-hydroxy-6-hydroxymethyldihydropteridine diphosphokinase [Desulfobacteraceae bacterium]|nr:2-amino-4-hydroxy-6-hydroxymethyldihydropteridine diphosphokinase [Desulfobacteraceae bacterium]
MIKTAYIGIGSNLGDKLENCLKAIEKIDLSPGLSIKGQSDFYRTEPVGVRDQDWYVNGVISLVTDLSPYELFNNLMTIELDMGRERKKKWDSRTIDLDILFIGGDIIDDKDLTVPHPLMHLRRFVLVPMVQLAPDFIHPVLDKTMTELLDIFSLECQVVVPLKEA